MIYKEDIAQVKDWVESHLDYCSKIWRVDFDFEHYDSEVETFYLRDHRMRGREILQFRHLFELEEKIQQEYGSRYKLGILYEEIPPE